MPPAIRPVHVVPSVADEASGPSYSVVRLCEALIDEGEAVRLATLDCPSGSSRRSFIRVFPVGRGPRRLGFSPRMRRWLREAASSGDIDLVHNHSLWMMPNVYAGSATRRTGCRLVVSPRGTLSEAALDRSAVVKRVFWLLLQGRAVRHAACFHATAELEYEDIRRAGFRQPVAIIPNGIDVPRLGPKTLGGRKQLLFLGRIHPIKGVDLLLHAWHALSQRFTDWQLRIVGPDNVGYLERMKALASALSLERVAFCGPLYGESKLCAYHEADLFVLPTLSENFGMTVAEALAAGTPAITTHGAPWAGLDQQGAGWWIPTGLDPLISCLEQALSESREELAARGAHGREWVQQQFSWKRVATMMDRTYRWIIAGGEVPSWIRLA